MQSRILVVEDNRSLNAEIGRLLKANHFLVVSAIDGLEGLVAFEHEQPDLLILNLNLPGLNGLEVCRRIRQRSYSPIMMLSALKNDAAKIAAFDLGVDDYLLLPFDTNELVARLRALLRRSAWTRLPTLNAVRAGNLEIDVAGRQVLRDGENIRLSRTEWSLLTLLIRRVGEVLTHRLLSQRLWGDDSAEDNVKLRVTMGRLRKKLEDDPTNPQYLLTEPGVGYRFAGADVKESSPLHLLAGNPVIGQVRPSLNNLPGQRLPFFGREAEIDAIKNELLRPTVRLVTLTGPGGAGKTRLSLQIASQIQADFEHGVYQVTLAGIGDPGFVIRRIAQVLGVKESSAQRLMDSLKDFLNDKQLLLILDNFEQVVEAATQVAELLDAAPRVKVLSTSRIRLKVAGEHVFDVPPLPLPDPANLPTLDVLRHIPSIALFVEHARAILSDFTLNAENALAVTEICVRLDGLPLAIELAARRIKVLTPKAMLTRLSNNLLLLVGDEQDRAEGHQMMRSTLDWSYQMLGQSERTLFAQMAVFVDGFTLEAAEVVCAISGDTTFSIIDGILSLLDKSMLQQHVEPLLEGYTSTRFTMLDLIHEYARERFAETFTEETSRERHALYYLALSEQADAGLSSPQEEIGLLQLERDYDNIQAGLEWANAKERMDIALRFCAALWKFWHAHGYQNEGKRWFEAVLTKTTEVEIPARVKALLGAGWIYYDQGLWDQAAAFYEDSLSLGRKLDDQLGIAEALHGVGEIARIRGDLDQAVACFQESLDLNRQMGNREGMAWSFDQLGRSAFYQGNHKLAAQFSSEALQLFRELKSPRGTAHMLGNLGSITLQQGDLEQAILYFQESVSIHERLRDRLSAVVVMVRLSEALYYEGELDKAENLLKTCLTFSQELGYRWYSALSLNQLAQVAIARGNYSQAEVDLREALRVMQNHTICIVALLEGFADQLASRGAIADAVRMYSAFVSARQSSDLSFTPLNRLREQRLMNLAHEALSDAEFAVAWSEGRAMAPQSLEDALKLVNPYSVTASVTASAL